MTNPHTSLSFSQERNCRAWWIMALRHTFGFNMPQNRLGALNFRLGYRYLTRGHHFSTILGSFWGHRDLATAVQNGCSLVDRSRETEKLEEFTETSKSCILSYLPLAALRYIPGTLLLERILERASARCRDGSDALLLPSSSSDRPRRAANLAGY